jgi:hypothetical protein
VGRKGNQEGEKRIWDEGIKNINEKAQYNYC